MGANYNTGYGNRTGFDKPDNQPAARSNQYNFKIDDILAKIKDGDVEHSDDLEQMMAEVQFISDNLNQNSSLGMKQKVDLYKYGNDLLRICMSEVNEMEQVVRKIQKGENGEPKELPFA